MEDKFKKNQEENDVELEEFATETELEDEEETSKDKIKQLRDKLKRAEQDKMSALEDLQRAKADFLNARRRMDEEKVRDRERAIINHVEDLLPLCDSFEMALTDTGFASASDNLQKGIRGIYSQLASILKGYGAVTLGEVGEVFDPSRHEAIANVEVDDSDQDHKVISVVQKGYKLGENVIRPARVTVGVLKS